MTTSRVALLLSALLIQPTFAQPDAFPAPDSLRPAIDFWKRVYTEADTRSGFLHDNRYLDVVYEHLEFGRVSSRERRRQTDAARTKYRTILNRLAEGSHDSLDAEERRVLELWPTGTRSEEFSAAAGRLRFQLGQSDRFLAGLKRSERWLPHIESVLRERGLPLELAVLPHVESSFEPTAYSHVGAAGLWQFTRSTGLRYMRIDHIVDERRDPFLSTYAAARLLEDNFDVIQSWPLALTAYNHGLAGMRRAANSLNTRDIAKIVAEYRGRAFGFASRNFYTAFVAALEIDSEPERYFGEIDYDDPLATEVIETTDYLSADTIAQAAEISLVELRSYNPALMDTVWAGDKLVPRGFPLRLPSRLAAATVAALATVPAGARFAQQIPDLQHRVARGDTLWDIARYYDVSLNALIRANSLRSDNLIRIGQVLNLPVDAATATLARAGGGAADYTVRRGDTMAVIAGRFGVTTQALLNANAITDANRIFIGQSLRIPAAASVAPGDADAAAPETQVLASVTPSALPVASTRESLPESRQAPETSQSQDTPRAAAVLQPIIVTGYALLQQIVSSAAAAEPAPVSIDL
ncbi:MAG TPA: LysM peptidoglycan-binding domain-containing protein, partial [Gammaproteobacteria bacterium]|nr:LysM peptidoglycan-binding domain-containing protein [Gammaproteobacteria bacterium]